jgi:hypothetical protein
MLFLKLHGASSVTKLAAGSPRSLNPGFYPERSCSVFNAAYFFGFNSPLRTGSLIQKFTFEPATGEKPSVHVKTQQIHPITIC